MNCCPATQGQSLPTGPVTKKGMAKFPISQVPKGQKQTVLIITASLPQTREGSRRSRAESPFLSLIYLNAGRSLVSLGQPGKPSE